MLKEASLLLLPLCEQVSVRCARCGRVRPSTWSTYMFHVEFPSSSKFLAGALSFRLSFWRETVEYALKLPSDIIMAYPAWCMQVHGREHAQTSIKLISINLRLSSSSPTTSHWTSNNEFAYHRWRHCHRCGGCAIKYCRPVCRRQASIAFAVGWSSCWSDCWSKDYRTRSERRRGKSTSSSSGTIT